MAARLAHSERKGGELCVSRGPTVLESYRGATGIDYSRLFIPGSLRGLHEYVRVPCAAASSWSLRRQCSKTWSIHQLDSLTPTTAKPHRAGARFTSLDAGTRKARFLCVSVCRAQRARALKTRENSVVDTARVERDTVPIKIRA